MEIIDPEKQNIIAGDWKCGIYSKDYLNYVDWENYRPRTKEIIKNGSLDDFPGSRPVVLPISIVQIIFGVDSAIPVSSNYILFFLIYDLCLEQVFEVD